jgi:hypothetical protein
VRHIVSRFSVQDRCLITNVGTASIVLKIAGLQNFVHRPAFLILENVSDTGSVSVLRGGVTSSE